jgi:TetR/AcrR family transcriptional repressor of uid operon
MPKLKPDVQRARREHILDAAQRCFARSGFHRTSIQDICREAGVSPGALYVYFDGKEALIAGISERDRAEFAERLSDLSGAPDFMRALQMLGEQYFLEEPADMHRMCIDVGLESTRNPRVGEIHRRFDKFILEGFEKLFQKLKDEGRIAPVYDIPTVARTFMVISDGMFWRRAIDPDFKPQTVMPATLWLVEELLKPVPASDNQRPVREE